MWTQIGRDRGRDGGEGRRDKQVKIDEIDGGGGGGGRKRCRPGSGG